LTDDHVTPVLRQLHWLPVLQRVDFKLATLVHRSLSGISPSDDCRLVADACERRLTFHNEPNMRCDADIQHQSTFGNRAFAAAGPGLWNSLPSHLKVADLRPQPT